jgi:alkylation response protein AidB-like acyl-CoA dehydrogenase
MSDLYLDQYARLLGGLPHADPWPTLAQSGFLDLLRPEEDGGAALSLEALFPLVIETGRRPLLPGVIETMAARLADREALEVTATDPRIGQPLAAAIAAALMAGAMGEVQAMTVAYATTRKQFGREIGRFQAVQQQIAVLAEEATAARMAAQSAFVGPVLAISPRRAAVAKLRAGQAAEKVCAIAHAVHGAIGVSHEHSLHHFTRRLRGWRFSHGGDSWWARRLGEWALSESQDVTSLARNL